MKCVPERLILHGSSKASFACGKLKSSSAWEVAMSEAPGYDSAQEQETPDRDPLVPQVFRSWDRPQAFFAIMGHVPPCVQHPQAQADLQGGDAPVTRNDW
jgi:hypothetical protein